jgi:hypothetical protein
MSDADVFALGLCTGAFVGMIVWWLLGIWLKARMK